MQRTYIEGFYAEELLERPGDGPLDADMSVPDDVRELTAVGSGYRAVEAETFDVTAMIAELDGKRLVKDVLGARARAA